MRHADVVLVEHLARAGVVGHPFEHDAVLLQHVPVTLLQHGAVEKAPAFACGPFDLTHPPEEHLTTAWTHRADIAKDAHIAAWACRLRVRDVQKAEHAAISHHKLGPVEVRADLADASDVEPLVTRLQFEQVLLRAKGQRETF